MSAGKRVLEPCSLYELGSNRFYRVRRNSRKSGFRARDLLQLCSRSFPIIPCKSVQPLLFHIHQLLNTCIPISFLSFEFKLTVHGRTCYRPIRSPAIVVIVSRVCLFNAMTMWCCSRHERKHDHCMVKSACLICYRG